MKLESLKSSKFEAFKWKEVNNLNKILGGKRYAMSSKRSGTVTATDTADLTDRNGNSYGGQPGDGTAKDWHDVGWMQCECAYHQPCEGQDPIIDPPYGSEAEFWSAETGEDFYAQV